MAFSAGIYFGKAIKRTALGKHCCLVLSVLAFLFAATPFTNQAFAYSSTANSNKTATKNTTKKKKPKKNYTQVIQERFSALVVNASNGQVLYEKNATAKRFPASLTKMMTLYLTFDALKKGKISMDDEISVSSKAASQSPTNISLHAGDRVPVRTAIESVIVHSANDSAMVLAEAIGGSESNFAAMMTNKARSLGMKDTVFRNPNGLPNPQQVTTAYDMARLAIALRRDFPQYYPMFKTTEFEYNGKTYTSHNRVLLRYEWADGLKTGYIRASGFNLVTSAKKDGYSLVGVIMGGSTSAARDNAMIDMLDNTFAELEEKSKTATLTSSKSSSN